MIFYQKLSTGKIELKKNATVNAISDSARAIIKNRTNDSISLQRESNKKINSNLQKKDSVKGMDTTKKSDKSKLPKSVEKKENKTLNLTPINE